MDTLQRTVPIPQHECPSAKFLSHLNRLRFSTGEPVDLPMEAARQGLRGLHPLGDGSGPSADKGLLTAQADKSLVKRLNFPDRL
jgi:hypothetical protein